MSEALQGQVQGVSSEQPQSVNQQGLVSVVTPIYNGERYVSRMLDSVLAQDYARIQMILCDDGSSDNTIRLARTYVPKFQAKGYDLRIVTSPHENASAAINAGLVHVTGNYLIWPDGDDELMPNSVSKRVAFLAHHPEYKAVRSLMEYVSEEDGAVLLPQENLGDLSNEKLFWDVLEARTFVCAGCYMLRTEEFFQIYENRKIPVYEVGQNFQMLLPFLWKYPCPTMTDKLYRVYVRAESHSRKPRSQAQERERTRDFEDLVDEIAVICGLINDEAAMDRFSAWKASRRAVLAWKHRQPGKYVLYRLLASWNWFRFRLRS